MKKYVAGFFLALCCLTTLVVGASAQSQPQSSADSAKKTNVRPADANSVVREPFDGLPIEKMSGQCVTLETEAGTIIIEIKPGGGAEAAGELLYLTVTRAFDSTPLRSA